MTTDDADLVVELLVGGLPDPIHEALAGVTVYVVQGRVDPELGTAIKNAGMTAAEVRRDFRALFLGAQQADGARAQGSIVINATVMNSADDVQSALSHEIGHALGMNEEEVENLGL